MFYSDYEKIQEIKSSLVNKDALVSEIIKQYKDTAVFQKFASGRAQEIYTYLDTLADNAKKLKRVFWWSKKEKFTQSIGSIDSMNTEIEKIVSTSFYIPSGRFGYLLYPLRALDLDRKRLRFLLFGTPLCIFIGVLLITYFLQKEILHLQGVKILFFCYVGIHCFGFLSTLNTYDKSERLDGIDQIKIRLQKVEKLYMQYKNK